MAISAAKNFQGTGWEYRLDEDLVEILKMIANTECGAYRLTFTPAGSKSAHDPLGQRGFIGLIVESIGGE